jgi:hypothetical protein
MSDMPLSAAWPNAVWWSALEDGRLISQNYNDPNVQVRLRVVDCGMLTLPSGRLVACDLFVLLEPEGNPHIKVPPGRYPVFVTVADVSGNDDRSHEREAYMTVMLGDAPEVTRRMLVQRADDEKPLPYDLEPDEILGFGVDAGTACFVDDGALKTGMPDPAMWYEGLFESGTAHSWFDQMDDPNHIQAGLANIPLPLATDGANIILVHSGWGDGVYPVVGVYDTDGQLVRVHVDFGVINDPDVDPLEE